MTSKMNEPQEFDHFVDYNGFEYDSDVPGYVNKNKIYEATINSFPTRPKISLIAPFIQILRVNYPCHEIDVSDCSLIKEITVFDATILNLGHQQPKINGYVEFLNLVHVYDNFSNLNLGHINVLK